MNERALYRRIARRETHQSRSTASVVVLSLTLLGAVYVGIEVILALVGAPPLLVAPDSAIDAVEASAGWLPWAGLAAVVFGVILLLVAVIPARRARHRLANDRMAVVVDDRVLAEALAPVARRSAGVPRSQIRAAVTRGRGLVTVTPNSGFPVSPEALQDSADRLLDELSATPRLRARVTVRPDGVVGA